MRYFRQYDVLYGSGSSAVCWQQTLHPWLVLKGFVQGTNELCAFCHKERKITLLSYMDSLLYGSSRANAGWFYKELSARFKRKAPQWHSIGRPLDHLGMAIFRDAGSVYISMENCIKTMLIKLGMEDAAVPNVRTPIHKSIEDMSEISTAQASFFMQVAGMLGWLASTRRPDIKYSTVASLGICQQQRTGGLGQKSYSHTDSHVEGR